MSKADQTAEGRRLREMAETESCREQPGPWRQWGPYLSERAWGTVREDYSADGNAWTYLTHDMARSKAFRWGEEGIAGFCDIDQILCFAPAFWNGRDPQLKERLFGLPGDQGAHGEDVKELYFYTDGTPTHSWMRLTYKYPQCAFPYEQLIAENRRRGKNHPEYEITDTGAFDQGRYFDIDIAYAKSSPDDLFVRIRIHNRGPDPADIWVLPQVWFRNTWSWRPGDTGAKPVIQRIDGQSMGVCCSHRTLGDRLVYVDQCDQLLFTENETNHRRLYGSANASSFVKDGINDYLVARQPHAASAPGPGTKAAFLRRLSIPPGRQFELRVRICQEPTDRPFEPFDQVLADREREADDFYAAIGSPGLTPEQALIQRQALAGMLWSKQFYHYDVYQWLDGDNPAAPPPKPRLKGRNSGWRGLYAADVMSMPDTWEYPWFAAWDLAFHAIPLAMVDVAFAKQQLELLIGEKLMHPSGQVPAYEWQFSDANPPVQAWAVWRVYNMEKHDHDEHGDLQFLERCYHKLLMNFTWWVNRKDREGRNVFEGGFLGLDNVSIFDRSKPLPEGGWLEQADGTGWMALFALNLMAIGLELAQVDRVYEHLGAKFFEHFMYIAAAVNDPRTDGLSMWDETDGWYYDIVHRTTQTSDALLRVRSLVGLVPLFAAQVLEERWFKDLPFFRRRYEWLLMNRPEFSGGISCVWTPGGHKCLLSLVNADRLQRILCRVFDENEFLSPFGVRSLSKYHQSHPFALSSGSEQWTIGYEPGEAQGALYGGNSNWRGPVWFPTNFMLITALRVYDRFFGSSLKLECPQGSGQMLTLNETAMEIARRLCSLFETTETGRRPCTPADIYQRDDFRHLVLFHEYFHGETGQGLGASHQTGWTGLVAKLLDQLTHA